MSKDIGQTVKALIDEYDEKALIEEVGLRSAAIRNAPVVAGEINPDVTYDAEHLGPMDDIKELSTRIFRRVERELHSIVCGSASEDKKDRDSILKATGLGDVALGAAIYSVLTGPLGMAPAIATVLAALLIKRIFVPSGEEVCKFWGEKIAARK
jgi:hypothetical protein